MADDNTSTANESQDKDANAGGQQADDSKAGADTQTAKTSTEGQQQQTQQQSKTVDDPADDKQFTQDQVNKIVTKRIDKAVRQALIKRGIDPDDKDGTTKPTVDTVTKERDDLSQRLRTFEARDQLETFIADKRNNIQASNLKGVFKYVKDELEFDDDGKVTNFKEVLAAAKAEAPELFRASSQHSIDAGAGSRQNGGVDMNSIIRNAAGR